MLFINEPTIHKKCSSVQSKIAQVKETRELVSSSSSWLLRRGMDNKLVMSDIGYVASFSGSFHGWNEFLTLLPDSFSVVLIHLDGGTFQILSLSQNSHFIFVSEEFDHYRPKSLSRVSGWVASPMCTFNHHLTTVQVKFLIDHTPDFVLRLLPAFILGLRNAIHNKVIPSCLTLQVVHFLSHLCQFLLHCFGFSTGNCSLWLNFLIFLY